MKVINGIECWRMVAYIGVYFIHVCTQQVPVACARAHIMGLSRAWARNGENWEKKNGHNNTILIIKKYTSVCLYVYTIISFRFVLKYVSSSSSSEERFACGHGNGYTFSRRRRGRALPLLSLYFHWYDAPVIVLKNRATDGLITSTTRRPGGFSSTCLIEYEVRNVFTAAKLEKNHTSQIPEKENTTMTITWKIVTKDCYDWL